MGDKIKKII